MANTATGSPAWALWQSMLHDSAWQAAAVEASGPTDTPADKKKVMVAVTELFAMWDSKVRAEFVTKRQRMEISKLRNIKQSSKEEQPVLVGARMELEVIRTPVDDSRRTWCLWKWLNSRLA